MGRKGNGNRRPHLTGGLRYNPEMINFAQACPFYPLCPEPPHIRWVLPAPRAATTKRDLSCVRNEEMQEGVQAWGRGQVGPNGTGAGPDL